MRYIKQKAFTLAEVMIVLVVIGVITGIVVPIMINSAPDKNVMKFKKANTTLRRVISELVNSDQYYKDGDLGVLFNDELSNKYSFCNSFADVLNAKSVNCNYDYATDLNVFQTSIQSGKYYNNLDIDAIKANCDKYCKDAENAYSTSEIGILTSDGVRYFEMSLENNFGCKLNETCTYDPWHNENSGVRLFNDYNSGVEIDVVPFKDGINTNRNYRVFCIDIDGIKKGEDPFGYGIRVDGKIITGARADAWLAKDFHGRDPSEQ